MWPACTNPPQWTARRRQLPHRAQPLLPMAPCLAASKHLLASSSKVRLLARICLGCAHAMCIGWSVRCSDWMTSHAPPEAFYLSKEKQ